VKGVIRNCRIRASDSIEPICSVFRLNEEYSYESNLGIRYMLKMTGIETISAGNPGITFTSLILILM
jgi:hypothetical protein